MGTVISMSHTIKNLRSIDDSAPGGGAGEVMEARFCGDALDATDTGLALISVKPGKSQPFAHKHENAEEVYVVVSGSGRVKLDDETSEIGQLDAIRVSPTVVRSFQAGPDGLDILAFGPRHKGDGEIIPGDAWN